MTDNMPDTQTPPKLKNDAPRPTGILPRNLQNWVIAGIAVVMLLIISLSGGKTPKETHVSSSSPMTTNDPSDGRIQEYRDRIERETKKLAAEQAELSQVKSALVQPGGGSPVASGPSYLTPPVEPPVVREKSWIETDREKREYESRFASNIALSHREVNSSPVNVVSAQSNNGTDGKSKPSKTDTVSAASIEQGKYRLMEGTFIETTLTNRLDGSFAGPANCMVSEDVYSHDRMKLLIPAGSRVLGEVRPVESGGQQRLAVTFHRLILPNGSSFSLDDDKGLDQIGATGLQDQVNHHYLQVFGVSFAIGAIAGLSQANSQFGRDASNTDIYAQGVASSLSQSSLRILDRYLNVLPTVTIREGMRVKIYLSKDLLLPVYQRQASPRDL